MPIVKIVPMPGPQGPAGSGEGGTADTGDITFDGVKIIGAGTAAGDESGNGTIELVPDADLTSDQYLIIDPTAPNHIHIRAGGEQDASNAQLIFGAEETNVTISDIGSIVMLKSTGGQYLNSFSSDAQIATIGDFGYLNIVSATDPQEGQNTTLEVPNNLTIQTYGNPGGEITIQSEKGVRFNYNPEIGGVYLNGNEEYPETQVATIGDIGLETSFTVNGGTTGVQPTFNGNPLFTGSYVKTGAMVHFRIDVDFDNITSFGTGQYYLDLPLPAKYNYEFVAGCLHDISETRDYPITGHVYAGESRMLLKSIDSQGNSAFAVPFTATAPITLAVADNFHISGNYIVDTEAP